MLRRIWQWIVSLFQGLVGGRQNSKVPPIHKQPLKPLDQADYEYLFMQMLEGVAHGWQQARVLKFFDALKDRITTEQWIVWLRGFGERLLASPVPNNQLAARMVHVGELRCGEIGEVAQEIGMQLLMRNPPHQEVAKEIGEQDASFAVQDLHPVYEYEEVESRDETVPQDSQGTPEVKQVTLEELLVLLEQDGNLVQQLAQQLQIETTDPQLIVQTLINQFNTASQLTTEQVEALLQQSVQQFQAGNYESAIASLDSATEIAPDNDRIWYSRGELMGILGRDQEAIASYDRATQINPDYYEAWYNRGSALKNLNCHEEALASYDRAIQIKQDYYEAWYNRGTVLRDLGRYEEAVASYDKALEIKPDKKD